MPQYFFPLKTGFIDMLNELIDVSREKLQAIQVIQKQIFNAFVKACLLLY